MDDIDDMDDFDASDFEVDDCKLILYFAKIVALEDTFLRIPGLKRSRSPETAEDNDDSFSFLNTEGNEHSPSPQQESPSTSLNIQSLHISRDKARE
jgi:hypothetical protein